MLQDRFRLQVHLQKKEMNVYYLAAGPGSSKLKRTGDARDADTQMRDAAGQMWATKFDMGLFSRYLGGELGLLADQTGLRGVYDFELSWSPDNGKPRADTDSPPSMVTAIKEQLGLSLKRGKGQVEVVVVDHAEKPRQIKDLPWRGGDRGRQALDKPALRASTSTRTWSPTAASTRRLTTWQPLRPRRAARNCGAGGTSASTRRPGLGWDSLRRSVEIETALPVRGGGQILACRHAVHGFSCGGARRKPRRR